MKWMGSRKNTVSEGGGYEAFTSFSLECKGYVEGGQEVSKINWGQITNDPVCRAEHCRRSRVGGRKDGR